MALPLELSKYWQGVSDLTIYEASLWMVIETDPEDHKFDLENNENYSIYFEGTGAASAVQSNCEVLISAVRVGGIKLSPIQKSPGNQITRATYILKLAWINWCRINNYTAISNLFSQHNNINSPASYIPSPSLPVITPAANSSFVPASLATTASAISVGAKNTISHKLNRNILDAAIDEAIKQAGNMQSADVWLKLKGLAIEEYSPFTGIIEGPALCYTNSNDKPAKLTKDALYKRLRVRRDKAA